MNWPTVSIAVLLNIAGIEVLLLSKPLNGLSSSYLSL